MAFVMQTKNHLLLYMYVFYGFASDKIIIDILVIINSIIPKLIYD